MQVQCPRCCAVFDTAESRHIIEQATAAPGELRTVIRPPAVTACEAGPDDHGPNAGGSDDYC
jgi:hypothetical protein